MNTLQNVITIFVHIQSDRAAVTIMAQIKINKKYFAKYIEYVRLYITHRTCIAIIHSVARFVCTHDSRTCTAALKNNKTNYFRYGTFAWFFVFSIG